MTEVIVMTDEKMHELMLAQAQQGDHPIAKLDADNRPWMRVHVSRYDSQALGKPVKLVTWIPILTPKTCPEQLRGHVNDLLAVMGAAFVHGGGS